METTGNSDVEISIIDKRELDSSFVAAPGISWNQLGILVDIGTVKALALPLALAAVWRAFAALLLMGALLLPGGVAALEHGEPVKIGALTNAWGPSSSSVVA